MIVRNAFRARRLTPLDWLIIALVLVIAFGGVAYAVPSRFQRRVGKMRLEARQHGFTTSLANVPDLDADAEDRVTAGGEVRPRDNFCAVYDKAYLRKLNNPPIWQLDRYKKSQVPIPGWLLRDNALAGVQLSDAGYWGDVAATIADMPPSCRGVASHADGVRWIGLESRDAVLEDRFLPELSNALDALRDMHAEMSVKNDQADDE